MVKDRHFWNVDLRTGLMEIKMIRREYLLLSPGDIWDFPDAVAQQLLDRGKAEKTKTEPEPKKKGGK